MASPGLQQSAVELLGRARECAVIDRLLADAGAGAGGALVVRGEAGIGKSALLPARERVLGPGHRRTLTTRHELAHWTAMADDDPSFL